MTFYVLNVGILLLASLAFIAVLYTWSRFFICELASFPFPGTLYVKHLGCDALH